MNIASSAGEITIKNTIKKLISILILVVFTNLGFIIFARGVYRNASYLSTIILLNVFLIVDMAIRPISTKKDNYKMPIIILAFLLIPTMSFLPYLEYKLFLSNYIPLSAIRWIAAFGIGLAFIGGMILLISRIQMGRYGGSRIVLEEDHQLITTGMYRLIRHPIYLGMLLLFFGYTFSFTSFICTCLLTILLFLIFKSRMDLEEKMLIASFGEEYASYIKRTKRLIPFIY